MRYMANSSIRDSNRTMYYIGHSLGGALATLAAAYFGSLYPDVRHVCITFGAPRVGNAVFISEFKKHVDESVRCVN
jgi:triacylglycerol lipase